MKYDYVKGYKAPLSSLPTSKTLNELMQLYMLTIEERKALIELKNKMLQIRKQIKESRK